MWLPIYCGVFWIATVLLQYWPRYLSYVPHTHTQWYMWLVHILRHLALIIWPCVNSLRHIMYRYMRDVLCTYTYCKKIDISVTCHIHHRQHVGTHAQIGGKLSSCKLHVTCVCVCDMHMCKGWCVWISFNCLHACKILSVTLKSVVRIRHWHGYNSGNLCTLTSG